MRAALQVVDVEDGLLRARDEDAVRAERVGDRAPGAAAGKRSRHGALRRVDHLDVPLRVQDVDLAAVGFRGRRHEVPLVDDRVAGEVLPGREPACRREGDARAADREAQRARERGDQAAIERQRVAEAGPRRRHGDRQLAHLAVGRDDDPSVGRGEGPGRVRRARERTTSSGAVAYVQVAVVPGRQAYAVVRDGEERLRAEADLVPDHAVVAEREDPEGHDLLREVRVRPLVRLALREQLERGARVIDLVEVHVAREIEAVAARREDGERDAERHHEIPPRRNAPQPETRWERPRRARGGERELVAAVAVEPGLAPREAPDDERGGGDHEERERDLTVPSEERRFEDVGRPQVDDLLIAREGEVERRGEAGREHEIRPEDPRTRRGERQEQGERREEVTLVRAGRQEVEGEGRECRRGE